MIVRTDRLPVLLLLVAAGCAPAPDRLPVSGTVTFKGQPLDRGRIEFAPDGPLTRFFSGAAIENGAFTVPANRGLTPGHYKVRVYRSDRQPAGRGKPPADAAATLLPPERVAPQYNAETVLTAEVRAGADNVFAFAVE